MAGPNNVRRTPPDESAYIKLCKGFKVGGAPCKRPPLDEDGFCALHKNDPKQPEKEARSQRNRVKDTYTINKRYLEVQLRMRRENLSWMDIAKEMDDEELARCDFRHDDGQFRKIPTNVPRGLLNACTVELLRRGRNSYRDAYLTSIEFFKQIVENKEADDSIRLKAAQYIWERVEGKIPERVEVVESAPWEDALLAAVVTEEQMMEKAKETLRNLP